MRIMATGQEKLDAINLLSSLEKAINFKRTFISEEIRSKVKLNKQNQFKQEIIELKAKRKKLDIMYSSSINFNQFLVNKNTEEDGIKLVKELEKEFKSLNF